MERVKFQEGSRGSLPAAGAAGVVPKLNAIFSNRALAKTYHTGGRWGRERRRRGGEEGGRGGAGSLGGKWGRLREAPWELWECPTKRLYVGIERRNKPGRETTKRGSPETETSRHRGSLWGCCSTVLRSVDIVVERH